ncbi:MAG: CRISPR-associated endonuclease Cas3'', partial [Planctomycetes bacterium]|nr:CRISPR-associated endonuclease Cas3'' [Planctomycetota bacterium]
MSDQRFYAHSRNDDGAGIPDPISLHLSEVCGSASSFAKAFDAESLAHVAGLLHDLGKYADQFKRRLENPSAEPARDHSIAGVAAILGCYKERGEMAALAVEGHHIGLRQIRTGANGRHAWETWLRQISDDLSQKPDVFTETRLSVLLERFRQDGGVFPRLPPGSLPNLLHDELASAAAMLDVRMLFSALVDADFLDTEAHFDGNAAQPRIRRPTGPPLSVDKCLACFDEYLREIRAASSANADIQALRDQLMQSCVRAATKPQGLFTLTAPTGAGKTLAMLAFALNHAKKWGLRRIVLVMPYLNIIEQTAKTYDALFGTHQDFPENFVLEDHSLA